MTQMTLPFKYEKEPTSSDVTALAGLPLYIELLHNLCFHRVVDHCVALRSTQGWTDSEMVQSLVLLNLAGGTAVDDITILEADAGLRRLVQSLRCYGKTPQEIKAYKKRWRQDHRRAFPSPSSIFRWLDSFHDPEQDELRGEHTAFIPKPTPALLGLYQANASLVDAVQRSSPSEVATLDFDATLVESHKKEACYCYKGFSAYQPLNAYWAEQNLLVHSEFRDGNVPAGYDLLRVVKETLRSLPQSVRKIYLRSDSAGYQWDVLKYCAEGRDKAHTIEFAVSADVTPTLKTAVADISEHEWQTLYKKVDGKKVATRQQWADVCYVPNEIARKKHGPQYRFIVVREPLKEQLCFEQVEPEQLSLPFPTMEMTSETVSRRYKITAVVTNRDLPGNELITWHRQRCGYGEKIQSMVKSDLAGGQLPSALFGANACWWAIVIISHNINVLMKTLVSDSKWENKRMKAIRFAFIQRPGRVMIRAHALYIRVHETILRLIETIRSSITQLSPMVLRE